MQAMLRRLDKWLATHRPRFHKNLKPGAIVSELASLQKSLGKTVPQPLLDWLTWHNGQGDDFVGYFEDHWLMMSADQIAAAKIELDDTGADHGWNRDWLPFLDDDGGNFVCLDLTRQPPTVMTFWMDAAQEKLAASLEAWLSDLVGAMEAGRYHEDAERGTFQRTHKTH
jgi:cell wall assembly regulator SMI1